MTTLQFSLTLVNCALACLAVFSQSRQSLNVSGLLRSMHLIAAGLAAAYAVLYVVLLFNLEHRETWSWIAGSIGPLTWAVVWNGIPFAAHRYLKQQAVEAEEAMKKILEEH